MGSLRGRAKIRVLILTLLILRGNHGDQSVEILLPVIARNLCRVRVSRWLHFELLLVKLMLIYCTTNI